MKAKFSEALRKRLESASANGSTIARDILLASRKHMSQLTTSKANYFDSLRIAGNDCDYDYRYMHIMITYCDKDLNNPNFPDRGNPQAPYLPENRKRCEPHVFAAFFLDLRNYSNQEQTFFHWALCCPTKITIVADTSVDGIYKAYYENHYSQYGSESEDTLHRSCMRYEPKAKVAADFYSNFAGCTVLRAVDEEGLTWGRAMVWNDVDFRYNGYKFSGSFLERIYFNYEFIRIMIIRKARDMGIMFRKYRNDYNSCQMFAPLNDFYDTYTAEIIGEGELMNMKAYKEVPANTWHKKGAPYLDTMYSVSMMDGKLVLTNDIDDTQIAECRSTSAAAMRVRYICPICGKVHVNGNMCPECNSKLFKDTFYGLQYAGKGLRKHNNTLVFGEMMNGRKPSEHYQMYLNVEKLYR